MLLVVHTHVAESIYAKFPSASEVFDTVIFLVAPFRMPVLMFLSGIFLVPSIAKGQKRFFQGKLNYVAYPFLIWTCVMYALFYAREVFVGKQWNVGFIEALFLNPIEHLWFVYYLFIFYLLSFFIRKANRYVVLFGVSSLYVASVIDEQLSARFFCLFWFFIIGSYVGEYGAEKLKALLTKNPYVWIAGLGVAIAVYALNSR